MQNFFGLSPETSASIKLPSTDSPLDSSVLEHEHLGVSTNGRWSLAISCLDAIFTKTLSLALSMPKAFLLFKKFFMFKDSLSNTSGKNVLFPPIFDLG